LKLCDYGYILENGKITMGGGGEEILQNSYIQKAYLGK
jgi:branched-chain amino acid transport system ATP-binding protein